MILLDITAGGLKKTTISHYNGDNGHKISDDNLERKLSDIKQ